jgi:hypothetical protein
MIWRRARRRCACRLRPLGAVDLDGADQFAVVLFDVEDFDFAAEGGDDVEQRGAGGVHAEESRMRLESGKRSAAQRKKAAEERSPGTVASMALRVWPPGMLSFSPVR